jgi:hypothetical protein
MGTIEAEPYSEETSMKARISIPLAVAVLALFPLVAGAEGGTGMSGYVVDASTKAPIAGVTVVIVRDEAAPAEQREVVTNRQGFFTDITLVPGRYMISADTQGHLVTCIVNDVNSGVVRHVNILIGHAGTDTRCVGLTLRNNMVDPDQTASIYRVP